MTVESVPVNSYDSRDSFTRLFAGYSNGIQHARLIDTTETTGVNSPSKPTNDIERIDKINKSKKEQDQFGKINKMNTFGKTG